MLTCNKLTRPAVATAACELLRTGGYSGPRADGLPGMADGVLKPLPRAGLVGFPVAPRLGFQGCPVAAAGALVRAQVVAIAIRRFIRLIIRAAAGKGGRVMLPEVREVGLKAPAGGGRRSSRLFDL